MASLFLMTSVSISLCSVPAVFTQHTTSCHHLYDGMQIFCYFSVSFPPFYPGKSLVKTNHAKEYKLANFFHISQSVFYFKVDRATFRIFRVYGCHLSSMSIFQNHIVIYTSNYSHDETFFRLRLNLLESISFLLLNSSFALAILIFIFFVPLPFSVRVLPR